MGGDDILRSLSDEIAMAGSPRGRWHSEYLGYSYRAAVEAAMERNSGGSPRVLKTDLWNECLGGNRDIVNHLLDEVGCRVVALELAYPICALGRRRVTGAHVVQADIRALPFRPASFDAVLDLSTLDHLSDAAVADAVGEYGRVLRGSGVVLLVFWQRCVLIRLRLVLKRLLGRHEKPGQHYFRRGDVQAALGEGLEVVDTFVAGALLTPPHRITALLLGSVRGRALTRFLRWLVRVEHSRALHPVLAHLAGLYGIVARRRDG
ncbi:MAG TPA: methyltransferase domain-containing protein [Thermoanaerobaculaceae bacterium]|nr:methyltransferase domain-containing protein [Thermoanaerobaculaceae bacterium]